MTETGSDFKLFDNYSVKWNTKYEYMSMNITKEIVTQLIRERRSIYPLHFDPDKKISNETIKELLELAVWAPNHGHTEPWEFKVFHGKGVMTFFESLKEIYKETTPSEKFKQTKYDKYTRKASQVSHIIALCMRRGTRENIPEIEEIEATACVAENIYISMKPFGIAGYLSTGDICYTQQMKDFLGLGPNDHCIGFFQLGIHPEEMSLPERKRISAADKTEWIGE